MGFAPPKTSATLFCGGTPSLTRPLRSSSRTYRFACTSRGQAAGSVGLRKRSGEPLDSLLTRCYGLVGTVWLDNGRSFGDFATVLGLDAAGREDPYVPLVLHRPKIAISPPKRPLRLSNH